MIASQNLSVIDSRVRFVVPEPDSRVLRVGIRDGQRTQYIEVIIDMHGLNRSQALRIAHNVINICHGVHFKLTLVHGMHRGQTLMTALRTSLDSPRIESCYRNTFNNGVTHFWISAGSYETNQLIA